MPGPDKIYTHITVLPKGPNSATDDNAIAFMPVGSDLVGVISSDREGGPQLDGYSQQRMFTGRMLSTTEFKQIAEVGESALLLPAGAGSYCAANGKYYFTGKAPNTDPNDFDLYVGKLLKADTNWTLAHVERMVALSKERTFDAQPALSPDGLTIYFVSDRAFGNGGTDIYFATRTNVQSEEWSIPEMLGGEINTACDEVTPSLSQDGNTLYFASNGHATVGGYDLFKSTRKKNASAPADAWDVPQNLGKPINSEYDEIFPVALNDTAFFYSSNQPTSIGGRNLYTITRTRTPALHSAPVTPKIEPPKADTAKDSLFARLRDVPVEVHGRITGGKNGVVDSGTQLFVLDPDSKKELARKDVNPSGDFLLRLHRGQQYDVGATNDRSFYDLRRIDLRTSTDTALNMNFALPDTLVLRINFPFDDHTHPYDHVIGDDGQELPMGWSQSLDLVAQSLKTSLAHLKRVMVIGYTDSLGTDAYNQNLGHQRATFVAEQLAKRGVPLKLITVLSKGRTMPVARRDGETDENFRLRSRRVEFTKVFK
jgi:hypothetical protein